jgi:hypothetical protein
MNHFATLSAVEKALSAQMWKQLGGQAGRVKYSSLFNSSGWIEVLRSTYNLAIASSTQNGLEGDPAEIQFCEIDDARGGRIVSLPFCDYCDPQISNLIEWQALIEPILARGKPTKLKVLRNSIPLADPRFEHRIREVWHATDLTKPEDVLWAGIDETARRNIRKAQRNGVTVRVGTTLADVMAFYAMHVDVRKLKYGLLAQPIEFFEAIHRAFSSKGRIFVLLAEKDGLPLAGILFLQHEENLYYKFNASRQTEYRPNDLLVWSGIRFGRERGLKLLDFGISALDQPGLVSFKRKFATEEAPVVQLTWNPQGYANHQGAKVDELLARLTQLLTSPDVPPSVGQKASKLLYPFFI